MFKIHAAALAAILALAPAAVLAQAPMVPGSQDPADPAIDFNETPDVSVTGVRDSDFTTSLSILGESTNFSIVEVGADGAFSAGANTPALQDSVAQNQWAMRALQAAGLGPENVVGIDAAGDGSVTLYVNT
jgi:hypothetical protein